MGHAGSGSHQLIHPVGQEGEDTDVVLLPLQAACDGGDAHVSALAVTLSAISVFSQSWVHSLAPVFTY